MAKKYYAVRAGRKTGIFETWDECRAQTTGFKGASFRSFPTRAEAEAYMQGADSLVQSGQAAEGEAVAYVDGSYHSGTNAFSCGAVLFLNGEELHFSQKFEDAQLAQMHNVAGEIKGAETILTYCMEHGVPRVVLYHDYEGVAKWATGEWKANKPGTIAYTNSAGRQRSGCSSALSRSRAIRGIRTTTSPTGSQRMRSGSNEPEAPERSGRRRAAKNGEGTGHSLFLLLRKRGILR